MRAAVQFFDPHRQGQFDDNRLSLPKFGAAAGDRSHVSDDLCPGGDTADDIELQTAGKEEKIIDTVDGNFDRSGRYPDLKGIAVLGPSAIPLFDENVKTGLRQQASHEFLHRPELLFRRRAKAQRNILTGHIPLGIQTHTSLKTQYLNSLSLNFKLALTRSTP
jgi:hypothetical protein